ncbi:hypothetical protein FQA39_LY01519 [Lamprigera yunnana]|nr:hypothetical protein FQA39_LY01519 [Lamprigera yunnana]
MIEDSYFEFDKTLQSEDNEWESSSEEEDDANLGLSQLTKTPEVVVLILLTAIDKLAGFTAAFISLYVFDGVVFDFVFNLLLYEVTQLEGLSLSMSWLVLSRPLLQAHT